MSSAIDPKKLQRAQAYYETGLDAAKKRNFEYALQMLGDACKLIPTQLSYRQGLRAIQRMKYDNDVDKVGMMARARAQTIRAQIRISKSTGAWLKVLETCEDAFLHNPWDVGTAMDAAEASLELGAGELAEWNLASVADEAGENVEYLRLKARVYEALGKWQAAIRCFELIRDKVPADQDITSKINALSAKAMMARSGLESGLKAKPAVIGDGIGQKEKSDESRAVGGADAVGKEHHETRVLSLEEQLKKRLAEAPDDIRAALELADIHKSGHRWDEADRVLTAAVKYAPEDIFLRQIQADTRIERMNRALENWDKHVSSHPDDAESIAKRAELVRKRDEFEVAEYSRRVSVNAGDAESQFRLGQVLARAERYDDAISAFQQARNHADWKVRALIEAGQCFEKIGSSKLAERAYSDALKSVAAQDTVTFNNLHYRLGCLAERNGKLQEAEEHFNEVAANDYGYKDVAKRLREIQSKI